MRHTSLATSLVVLLLASGCAKLFRPGGHKQVPPGAATQPAAPPPPNAPPVPHAQHTRPTGKSPPGRQKRARPHPQVTRHAKMVPEDFNHPEFPTVVLRAGQTYRTTTTHKFSAK